MCLYSRGKRLKVGRGQRWAGDYEPHSSEVGTRTPEALAKVLGLSNADAKEWQIRYRLRKRSEVVGVADKDHRLARVKRQR